jgi:hypothetical protein
MLLLKPIRRTEYRFIKKLIIRMDEKLRDELIKRKSLEVIYCSMTLFNYDILSALELSRVLSINPHSMLLSSVISFEVVEKILRPKGTFN